MKREFLVKKVECRNTVHELAGCPLLLGLTCDTCRTYIPSLPVQCSLLGVGSPTVFSQGWFPGCKDWRCYFKVSACVCLQSKERVSAFPNAIPVPVLDCLASATGPEFSAISLWGACRHRLNRGLPSSIHARCSGKRDLQLPVSQSLHTSAWLPPVLGSARLSAVCPVDRHLWLVIAPLCLGPDVLVVFLESKWIVVRSGFPLACWGRDM